MVTWFYTSNPHFSLCLSLHWMSLMTWNQTLLLILLANFFVNTFQSTQLVAYSWVFPLYFPVFNYIPLAVLIMLVGPLNFPSASCDVINISAHKAPLASYIFISFRFLRSPTVKIHPSIPICAVTVGMKLFVKKQNPLLDGLLKKKITQKIQQPKT